MLPAQSKSNTIALLIGTLLTVGLANNTLAASPRKVRLPMGSVDQLAAKITEAGRGGTVIVESGLHTESGTVLVTIPVKIIGEAGAIITCGTAPSPLTVVDPGPPLQVTPSQVVPTLHIKGADDVTVQGIEFVPLGPAANCAVLIHNSDRVEVRKNHIQGFQHGVLVQHGNRAWITENIIECAPLWLSDPQYSFVQNGIIVYNGEFARITRNQVSGAVFGIFGNDQYGQMAHNTVSGCIVGYVLCHALPGIVEAFGESLFAEVACTSWVADNNTATGNVLCGYLVIDSANHNLLVNNAGSGNPVDMILTGDGDFFGVGIFMPASYNNVVVLGTHKDLAILDNGNNNLIR